MAPAEAPSRAMDWRRPKAAVGLSPDEAASSPMSALEGASRMPLAARSKICTREDGEGRANRPSLKRTSKVLVVAGGRQTA